MAALAYLHALFAGLFIAGVIAGVAAASAFLIDCAVDFLMEISL